MLLKLDTHGSLMGVSGRLGIKGEGYTYSSVYLFQMGLATPAAATSAATCCYYHYSSCHLLLLLSPCAGMRCLPIDFTEWCCQALAAIGAMNGREFNGHTMTVRLANNDTTGPHPRPRVFFLSGDQKQTPTRLQQSLHMCFTNSLRAHVF